MNLFFTDFRQSFATSISLLKNRVSFGKCFDDALLQSSIALQIALEGEKDVKPNIINDSCNILSVNKLSAV